MAIAQTLIADALIDLEIRSSETQITDSEYDQGVRYLNRIMTTWAEDGLNVGYSKVTNKDQETDIPDWFEMCAISHLGIALAPSFGVSVDPRRLAIAAASLKAVRGRLITLGPVAYPNSLPLGSGNNRYTNTNYFSGQDPKTLTGASDGTLSDGEGVDLSA